METSIFEMMEQKQLDTEQGSVFYWYSQCSNTDLTLVFLHGLTADHTLFEKQISHFLGKARLLCWDAPAHGKSRPYQGFSYDDAAKVLKAILEQENIKETVFIGQSMGGYVIQTLLKHEPQMVKGFIGIDTCPFGERYYSRMDRWWLRQMEWMCMCFPHSLLIHSIAKTCTYTRESFNNMRAALSYYSKRELCHLLGAGYSGFLKENCDLIIKCPALILVGEYDNTGKVKKYCTEWHDATQIPLVMISNASHNSNYDNPQAVNREIDHFIQISI